MTIRKKRRQSFHQEKKGKKDFLKNEEIRSPEVSVIDETGEKLGIMSFDKALSIAQDAGFDLVEVSPQANPPVCKIMDFGKLQYEKAKQDRKNRAQSKKAGETKGIRLTPGIGDHDLQVRIHAGQKFLEKGHKLKIELRLRGREKAHPEIAQQVIEKYIKLLNADITLEQPVKHLGGNFSAVVSLKKSS